MQVTKKKSIRLKIDDRFKICIYDLKNMLKNQKIKNITRMKELCKVCCYCLIIVCVTVCHSIVYCFECHSQNRLFNKKRSTEQMNFFVEAIYKICSDSLVCEFKIQLKMIMKTHTQGFSQKLDDKIARCLLLN